jgi:predicted restriction endonuclease
MNHFDIGEQDLLTCEACLKQGRADAGGFDIHHINGRGKGNDEIKNIMCLCRKHHTFCHNGEISKSQAQYIHNNYMNGQRKVFVK